MKTKTFDCVEMKRRGAEEVQKALIGLTPEQELAFWESGTTELKRRQAEVRAAKQTDTQPASEETSAQ